MVFYISCPPNSDAAIIFPEISWVAFNHGVRGGWEGGGGGLGYSTILGAKGFASAFWSEILNKVYIDLNHSGLKVSK